jgi:DNA polymerase/3'-5' exonuclease PolX
MSEKQKFPWEIAKIEAEVLVSDLAFFCSRIAVAGSVRRLKPHVSDIEIVYVAKTENRGINGDMWAREDVDLANEQLSRMIDSGQIRRRLNIKGQTTWGDQIKLAELAKCHIPVDFFPICEASWFNYLVCRTGPKDSNVAICMAAEKRGLQWKPYSAGFMDVATMEIKPVHSEREVFETVGLPYFEPKDRK